MDAARVQNPAAFAVRPDLFTLDNVDDMGGGCARLVRYVDTPGISWEVVYGEEFGPVVHVCPVRPDHSPFTGEEPDSVTVIDGFTTARRALAVWESWAPAYRPPVCSGCGVSVAPGSGVAVNEVWANMTGDLVCEGCIASARCDLCQGGLAPGDISTCETCRESLGGAE